MPRGRRSGAVEVRAGTRGRLERGRAHLEAPAHEVVDHAPCALGQRPAAPDRPEHRRSQRDREPRRRADAGLAWDTSTGTLYLSAGSLYPVDPSTGVASAIGVGYGVLSLHGLAYDPTRDALVGVEDTTGIDSRSWEISRTTGLPTSMGTLGVPIVAAGLAYDPTQDVFWITDNEVGVSDYFYVAPGARGDATRVGGLSQQTGNDGLPFVPEPGTGLLLGLGLAVMAARRRAA